MRQIKSFSLAKQQTEFLKTFCRANELKESEVMQWLIDKLSIDKKMQEYCFHRITAKRSAIEKQMATSDNVQTVKEKDASEPVIRDISAKDNINYEEKLNNIYELWNKKTIPNWMLNEEWRAWYDIHPEEANKWAERHF